MKLQYDGKVNKYAVRVYGYAVHEYGIRMNQTHCQEEIFNTFFIFYMNHNYLKHCLTTAAMTVALLLMAVAASAQAKTAYGVLCYDETNVHMLNGLVKFPLTDGGTFEFQRFFGSSDDVTAAAYGDGYYYVARSYKGSNTEGSGEEILLPTDLLRYDFDTDEVTTVGNITGVPGVVYDMTYDNTTQTFYAISYDQSAGKSQLFMVDTRTGRFYNVDHDGGYMDRSFATLACSFDGQLYGVAYDGSFCKIDKATGKDEVIANTGLYPAYLQTMEFDHSTGALYWAGTVNYYDKETGTAYQTCFIGQVNVATGQVTLLGTVGDNPQIAGLYIPFSAAQKGAPAAATGLIATTDATGLNRATLAWTNPSLTFDGQPLTELTKVEVYRNKTKVATLTGADATPGKAVSYVDNTPDGLGQMFNYHVYAYNATGKGAEASVRTFVGHDTPSAPAGVKLTRESNDKVTVSWDAVTTSVNGGYLDLATLKYNVVRQPDGKQIATGTTATSVTDANITPANQYSYTVTAVNADAESKGTTSDTMALGPVYPIPSTFDFATCEKSWLMVDADGDGFSWVWADKETGRTISHQGSNMKASDDWLISYMMPFEAGKCYTVTLNAQTFSDNKVDFYLLSENNYAAPVQQLAEVGIAATEKIAPHTFVFRATKTGNFSLGLHAVSPQNAYLLDLYSLTVRESEEHNIAVISLTGATKPFIGRATTYQLTVENQGTKKTGPFVAILEDQDGNEITRANVSKGLEFGERYAVDLEWKTPNTSVTALKARLITWDAGDNPDDNASAPLAVKPRQPYDGKLVPIPYSPTTSGWFAPFYLGPQHSASQSIYSAAEIGSADAQIDRLAWIFANDNSDLKITGANAKIYLANTDMTKNTQWIPEENYTLVYDGPLEYAEEASAEITVALQTPFLYKQGKNLAVLTVTDMADELTSYNYIWYASYTKGTDEGARIWYQQVLDEDKSFDWTQGGYIDNNDRLPAIMLYLDESKANGISNPVADMGGADYELFTLDGQKAAAGKLSANGSVPTTALKSGVYVVKATKNGHTTITKISVNR